MNHLFIANWKSHKTSEEALNFLKSLKDSNFSSEKNIIICPSFPCLAPMHDYIQKEHLSIKLGAQNISEYGEGAYTGEVNAVQVKELCEYVIIGHSERRTYLHESDDSVEKKVSQALKVGLTPILCIQDEHTPIPEGITWVAYEPVFAIGSGTPDTPENITTLFSAIHEKNPAIHLLYGGSVKRENIHTFLSVKYLEGFLIGGASLLPDSFISLLAA